MEKDDEITGSTGSHYTAEYWMYDSRLGRRWNVDPVVKPHESPYASFFNNPIIYVDPDGDNPREAGTEVSINRFWFNVKWTSRTETQEAFIKKINDRDLWNSAHGWEVLYGAVVPSPNAWVDRAKKGLEALGIAGFEFGDKMFYTKFMLAAESDKYILQEIQRNDETMQLEKYIVREVVNYGEGFEAEVHYKEEYNVSYSSRGELVMDLDKITDIEIVENEQYGIEGSKFKDSRYLYNTRTFNSFEDYKKYTQGDNSGISSFKVNEAKPRKENATKKSG